MIVGARADMANAIHPVLLVFFGWMLGYRSAAIASAVYPPTEWR